jgi:hypothetical protein
MDFACVSMKRFFGNLAKVTILNTVTNLTAERRPEQNVNHVIDLTTIRIVSS